MFCSNCGKKIGQVKFCPDCGRVAGEFGMVGLKEEHLSEQAGSDKAEQLKGAQPTLRPITAESIEQNVKVAEVFVKNIMTKINNNEVSLTLWGAIAGLAYGLMVYTSGIRTLSFVEIVWNFSLADALKIYEFGDYVVMLIVIPAVGGFIGNRLQKLIASKQ